MSLKIKLLEILKLKFALDASISEKLYLNTFLHMFASIMDKF